MAIKNGINNRITPAASTDATLLEVADGERVVITQTTVFEGSNTPEVTYFISPNSTSAAGIQIDQFTLSANDSYESAAIAGYGMTGPLFLVVQSDLANTNFSVTYALFTADDV